MEEKIEKKEKIEDSACCASSSSCCTPATSCCGNENMVQGPILDIKEEKIEMKENMENTACCASSSSCCGSDSMKVVSIPRNPDKLNIDIFVPLSACSCEWDKFMNGIFTVITPYMKNVDFQTKDLNSDEARNQGVFGNCVVVDGKTKFTNSNLLRKQLPLLLKERGLI
ncbi:MAG: hypothetical protein ACTSQD_03135 [Promethearchaeota archaeon]